MRASDLIKITIFNFSHGDTSLDTQMGYARVRPEWNQLFQIILFYIGQKAVFPRWEVIYFVILYLRRACENPLMAAINKN